MKHAHHILIRWPARLLQGVAWLVIVCFTVTCITPGVVAAKSLIEKQQAAAPPVRTDLESVSDTLVELEELLDRMDRRVHGRFEYAWQETAARQTRLTAPAAATRSQISELQASVNQALTKLEGLQGAVAQSFAEDEAHLRSAKLPAEILGRLQAQKDQYAKLHAQLKTLLGAIAAATTEASHKRAVAAAHDFLATHSSKPARAPFDPEHLAFGVPKERPRQPLTDPAALRAALSAPVSESKARSVKTSKFAAVASGTKSTADDVPPDLAPTEDVQITDAIRAKAVELHNNPLEIYQWVRNNVEFVPTYGSIQGSDYALKSMHGNAFDQASLLIALLRAANIPSRYVYGTVEIPIAQVMNWVGGVTNPNAALDLLGQGGIPAIGITEGGVIKRVRMEHVWIEAHLGYLPARGAKNFDADTWISLDPSFKQYEYVAPIDVVATSGFTPQALVDVAQSGISINHQDGWFQGLNAQGVNELIEQSRSKALALSIASQPDLTIEDVIGHRDIRADTAPILHAGLPYSVRTVANTFPALPATLRYSAQLRYYASDFDLQSDSPSLISNTSLPKLGDQTLEVAYVPASAADAATISDAINQGAGRLSLSTIRVKPTLLVGGVTQAEAPVIGMGSAVYWSLLLKAPGQTATTAEYATTAGDALVFGINLGDRTFAHYQAVAQQYQAVDAADNLRLVALSYWFQHDLFDRLIAKKAGMTTVRLPSAGLFASRLNVNYFFGIPRTGYYLSRSMDVKRNIRALAGGTVAQRAVVLQGAGVFGSYLEGFTFDELLGHEPGSGRSATRLIQEAIESGNRVYRIDASNLTTALAAINVGSDVKLDISNAVAAGQFAIVPDRETTTGNWQGTGYYLVDPSTGAGSYLLTGGYNGGDEGSSCSGEPSPQPVSNLMTALKYLLYFILAVLVIVAAIYGGILLGGLIIGLGVAGTATAGTLPGGAPTLEPPLQNLWDQTFRNTIGEWPAGPAPGNGMTPPGNCTIPQLAAMEQEKDALCNDATNKPLKCTGQMSCADIQDRMTNRTNCILKRLEIMAVCFNGGDDSHWGEVKNHLNGLNTCRSCLARAQANQCNP